MRRTQLYLDDELWGTLHARARRDQTTVSELVRQAVRERYLGGQEQRLAAMMALIGSAGPHPQKIDSTEQVRALRRGSRMKRLR